MRWDAKTDANQQEIVDALRKAGASVLLLHRVGGGCPDILVGWRRQPNYLMEIKTPDGSLNEKEQQFFRDWKGQRCVVRSAEEALRVIGAVSREYEINWCQYD